MRKTKIICTLGPASETEETIEKLMKAGMNVARFNFSHGTHEWHKTVMDRVKKIREKLDLPVAIMLDTKGPEYRIGTFADGPIELKDGDSDAFTTFSEQLQKEYALTPQPLSKLARAIQAAKSTQGGTSE